MRAPLLRHASSFPAVALALLLPPLAAAQVPAERPAPGVLPAARSASAPPATLAGAGASGAPAQGAQAAAAPRLELETLAGEVRVRDAALGPLTSLTAEGAAFARITGRPAALPVTLDPTAVAELTLVGGDRVRGAVRTADADTLALDLGGAVLPVSVDSLAALVLPGRIPRGTTTTPTPAADADVLYLIAGQGLDRAEGLLEAFDAEGVVFEDGRAGRRNYPWSRVAALFVAPLEPGEQAGEQAGERAGAAAPLSEVERGLDPVVVGLEGGGRLTGRLRSLDGARVVLRRPGGVELAVPAELVTDVSLADGSFVFLSDLPIVDGGPVSVFGDDLGFTWPHRIDRAVDGGPLRVAGRLEPRGIGVHAPSRLTWRLDTWPQGGERARLRFSAGVDDSGLGTERSGSVRFRVLGDGRELWASGLVRAGQAALAPAPITLDGVRELVLEVDPDGDFVLDRADWLRPLLVRGER